MKAFQEPNVVSWFCAEKDNPLDYTYTLCMAYAMHTYWTTASCTNGNCEMQK